MIWILVSVCACVYDCVCGVSVGLLYCGWCVVVSWVVSMICRLVVFWCLARLLVALFGVFGFWFFGWGGFGFSCDFGFSVWVVLYYEFGVAVSVLGAGWSIAFWLLVMWVLAVVGLALMWNFAFWFCGWFYFPLVLLYGTFLGLACVRGFLWGWYNMSFVGWCFDGSAFRVV